MCRARPRKRTGSIRETAEPAPDIPTDLQLLGSVAAGDGAAFGVLAERLTPMLKRVLYRFGLSDPDVEEVLQETLVSIWRGSAGFRGHSSVSTWACQIAVNKGISVVRRSRTPFAGEEPTGTDVEAEWQRTQDAAAVRHAVLELPPPLRSVIVLREFEDLAYRTIAEILEIPMGTVMSRLHVARSKLRRRLGELAPQSPAG